MIEQLIILAVQPTPYNAFLFRTLREKLGVAVSVNYSMSSYAQLPWKQDLSSESDRFFNTLFGMDWRVVAGSVRSHRSLYLCAGWSSLTNVCVMLARSALRLPTAVWTDTVRQHSGWLRRLRRQTLLHACVGTRTAILATGEVGVRSVRACRLARPEVPVLSFPFCVPLREIPSWHWELRERTTFVCACRLVERKGVDLAIDGIRRLVAAGMSEVQLLLAGVGSMETELRDRVRDLRLGDHIRFLGWLEANQLQHILWSSSVFLHVVPEHDPFPVAVLEAMASGLPVISTRLAGSAVDRVEEGVTGFFVDPERPSELEHAMARFAQDRPLAISMGQKARIRAEEWPVERGVATIRELFQLLS